MEEKVLKRVLLPVDFSDVTEAVVQSAKVLGQKFKPKFYLLHVITPLVYVSVPESMVVDVIDASVIEEIEQIKRKNAENFLRNLAKMLEGFEVEIAIDVGNPADVILEKEELYDVDLTILGGHEKSLVERILLGSTSEAVAKHSKRPVLVIKGHALEKLSPVVLGYDFSEAADGMIEFMLRLLKPFGSKVVLVHVDEEIELPLLKKLGLDLKEQIREKKEEKLKELCQRFKDGGMECEAIFVEERSPVEGILKVAEEKGAEMVAVADRGLSGLKRILMGSVSLGVLRKSPVPTLVYKKRRS